MASAANRERGGSAGGGGSVSQQDGAKKPHKTSIYDIIKADISQRMGEDEDVAAPDSPQPGESMGPQIDLSG